MAATVLLNNVSADTTSSSFDVSDAESATLVVSGTWAGTISVQTDVGDGNFGDATINRDGSRALVSTITSNGSYTVDARGKSNLRVSFVRTSGSVTVKANKLVGGSTLPTGAATAAKQPALGTAGTPSADVISVQGVSGGTPQPVSQATSTAPLTGQVTASGSATQFSSHACSFARIKALSTNTTTAFIGPSGETSGTGFELSAGDDTGWLPIDNLNRLYYIAGSGSPVLCWMTL